MTRRRAALAALALAVVGAEIVAIFWLDRLLRAAGRADLTVLTSDGIVIVIGMTTAAVLGAVVAARTQHPVAWLLVALAFCVVTSGFTLAYATYGGVARPGALPAAGHVARFGEAAFWPAFGCLALVLLLTPTGHLPSQRWRFFPHIVGVGTVAWMVATLIRDEQLQPPLQSLENPMSVDALAGVAVVLGVIGIASTHIGLLLAAGSLVRRYRRSSGIERQQLRWVAFGGVVALVALGVTFTSALLGYPGALNYGAAVFLTVLPASVAVAISRYRLYDLDRLISRSATYALLSSVVAVVYAGAVVMLGALGGTGEVRSGAAAVIAAIAATPLRSLAQRTVDRSLFGRRAEPFAVVSGLNRRLQESASPSSALHELVDTVATDLRLPYVAIESPTGAVLAAAGAEDDATERLALAHQGEPAGTLVLGLRKGEAHFGDRDRVLLDDLARHAGAAVHAAAVLHDLQVARQRLVAAREEERRRLRRDLHDGLGPQLTAVTLKVDAARNLLARDALQADLLLGELRNDVKAAIDDIRRVVYGLRPPGLDDLGLLGALRQHARAGSTNGTSVDVVMTGRDAAALPAPVEVAAYRIASEAVTNAFRHAHADHCVVTIDVGDDVTVEVVDDGRGLPAEWQPGVGTVSMRERAAELGGTCVVERGSPSGTRVVARLPVSEGVS